LGNSCFRRHREGIRLARVDNNRLGSGLIRGRCHHRQWSPTGSSTNRLRSDRSDLRDPRRTRVDTTHAHNRLGAGGPNWRWTSSAAQGAAGSAMVVHLASPAPHPTDPVQSSAAPQRTRLGARRQRLCAGCPHRRDTPQGPTRHRPPPGRETPSIPPDHQMANRMRRPDQHPQTRIRLGPHPRGQPRRSENLDRTRGLHPQPDQNRRPNRLKPDYGKTDDHQRTTVCHHISHRQGDPGFSGRSS
jgi:hypothetical protein